MVNYLKSSIIQKTRKPVACIWCGETITRGGPAFLSVYADNGEIYSDRYHLECNLACAEYYRKEQCWGESFEPYEAARGSTLCKHDYKIMQNKLKDGEP